MSSFCEFAVLLFILDICYNSLLSLNPGPNIAMPGQKDICAQQQQCYNIVAPPNVPYHAHHKLPGPAPNQQPGKIDQEALDLLGWRVVGMTAGDNGPHVLSQPEKLWVPRDWFQATWPTVEDIPDISAPTAAIQEAMFEIGNPMRSSPEASSHNHGPSGGKPVGKGAKTAAHHRDKQLHMAADIQANLGKYNKDISKTPFLELFYRICQRLQAAPESLKSLNSHNIKTKVVHTELSLRMLQLHGGLEQWKSMVIVPKERQIYNTST